MSIALFFLLSGFFLAALLGATERSRKLQGIAGAFLVAIACIIVFLRPVQLPPTQQLLHGTTTTTLKPVPPGPPGAAGSGGVPETTENSSGVTTAPAGTTTSTSAVTTTTTSAGTVTTAPAGTASTTTVFPGTLGPGIADSTSDTYTLEAASVR